ncbi:hypothetical protein FRC03_001290 [Tulasnella sp. 419]|nr:hypothetical protein FRC03_001290 [Tulasnella sp. 419]
MKPSTSVGGLPQSELNQSELHFLLNDFRLCIRLEELLRYADQLVLYPHNNVPSATQLPEDDLHFFREKIEPVPIVGHPPPHYAPQHYISSPPTTGANSSRDPPPSSYHPAQPTSSSSQIRRTPTFSRRPASPFLLPFNLRPTPSLLLLLMDLIAPTPPLPQSRRHPLLPSLRPNSREGIPANRP